MGPVFRKEPLGQGAATSRREEAHRGLSRSLTACIQLTVNLDPAALLPQKSFLETPGRPYPVSISRLATISFSLQLLRVQKTLPFRRHSVFSLIYFVPLDLCFVTRKWGYESQSEGKASPSRERAIKQVRISGLKRSPSGARTTAKLFFQTPYLDARLDMLLMAVKQAFQRQDTVFPILPF